MTVLEEESVASDATPEIQQPARSVLFIAKRSDLRLVWVPRHPIINPASGVRTGMSRGRVLAFRDGSLTIPLDNPDGMVHGIDTADAGDWSEETDVVLEWLRNHRLNGDFQEGFEEVKQTAPEISDAELDLLQEAAINFDMDALRAFIAKEESGWQREQLLGRARKTLEKIEVAYAAAEAKAAEEYAAAVAAAELVDQEQAVKAAEAAAGAPVDPPVAEEPAPAETPAEPAAETPAE